MTYELLEKAPKDHLSDEFLQFLRENNEVIEENDLWLIVANCKYDTPGKRWYTAFWKPAKIRMAPMSSLGYLSEAYGHLTWLIKAPKDRSVKRFHVHLYE